MGPVWLLKRVAGCLVAVGLLVASVAGVSADEGGEEAEAGAALQPTQVVAEVPVKSPAASGRKWKLTTSGMPE